MRPRKVRGGIGGGLSALVLDGACVCVRWCVCVCVRARARLRACVRACGIEHGWLVCLTSSTHGWVCLTSSTHAGVPDVFHVRGMSQTVFHG